MLRTTRRMLLLFVLVVLSPPPLLAQTVHSRFATVNGVRLHYLEAGTGSPIILLHGFGEPRHMWLVSPNPRSKMTGEPVPASTAGTRTPLTVAQRLRTVSAKRGGGDGTAEPNSSSLGLLL